MSNIAAAILVQKYKEYKNKLLNSCFGITAVKPMMKYREIDIVTEILKALRPRKCLEWGSGYGTMYFPSLLDGDAKWTAVEHNQEWALKVQDMNKRPNVSIFHVSPNSSKWTDPDNDGAFSDLEDYIEFPGRFGTFDFILVDGRARKECMARALKLITDNGIVVLHDANREYYHETFGLFEHGVYFENYRPNSHGLFIGSRGAEIGDVLDVEKHKKLWGFYNGIASLFHKKN
jgi:hypothetical protein